MDGYTLWCTDRWKHLARQHLASKLHCEVEAEACKPVAGGQNSRPLLNFYTSPNKVREAWLDIYKSEAQRLASHNFWENWLCRDVLPTHQRYILALKGSDSRKLEIFCSHSTVTPVISAVRFNSVMNNCLEFPPTLQSAGHGCAEWLASWHTSHDNVPAEVVKTPTGGPSAPGNPGNPDLPWGPCLRKNAKVRHHKQNSQLRFGCRERISGRGQKRLDCLHSVLCGDWNLGIYKYINYLCFNNGSC